MAIGIDITDPTTVPDTTKTKLNDGNDVVLPTNARSILALIPYYSQATPTAQKSVMTKIIVESDDIALTPLEFLMPPLAIGQDVPIHPLYNTPWKIPVNIPVKGGDRIRIYAQGLLDSTTDPIVSVGIVLSDHPSSSPQLYAKVSDYTSTGTTTDIDVSGGTITLTNAHQLVEAWAATIPGATASGDAINGYAKFVSTSFSPPFPLKIPMPPVGVSLPSAVAGAVGVSALMPAPVRCPIDIGVQSPATIEVYAHYGDLPAAAGGFATCLMYR